MGAFFIYNIVFKSETEKRKFERKFRLKPLVDIDSDCYGFCAWQMFFKPTQGIYFLGFQGYAEWEEFLDALKVKNIRISRLSIMPINDAGAQWEQVYPKSRRQKNGKA